MMHELTQGIYEEQSIFFKIVLWADFTTVQKVNQKRFQFQLRFYHFRRVFGHNLFNTFYIRGGKSSIFISITELYHFNICIILDCIILNFAKRLTVSVLFPRYIRKNSRKSESKIPTPSIPFKFRRKTVSFWRKTIRYPPAKSLHFFHIFKKHSFS